MKRITTSFLLLILLISCKDEVTKNDQLDNPGEVAELSTAEAVADRYGVNNWDAVSEINFTFNVESGPRKFKRTFQWFPKTQDVIYKSDTDTIAYNRNATLDSLELYADKRFVNDSYWLLAPFKLVWDEGVSFSEERNVVAPISGDTLHKLTILYDTEGGYTPGDAYDLYITDDFIIKEWGYRSNNAEKASTSTLWMEEKSFDGIVLNTMHQDSTASFRLFFTDITIK